MSYDEFHHQIQSYERKLARAWEVNDDLQVEIKDLHKKLGEAPHSSVPSVPPPPPVTSDEQFACDFKHAQITSLGGEPHYDQPGVRTSSSMWDAPLPNTFSSRGRVQVEQPTDHKGKQRQPSPPQVEPACPPMEDKITPSNLYANVPMTIDEPIIQGTMFPNFDRTEFPYRVHHLGQGNDSVRLILFMRINDNLYAYSNEMISKAIQWERDMMGPIILYNTMEEIHKLYAMAYDEPEDKAPCICKVQGLVTYINLWKRCRLEINEVMDLTLKEWRPPVWASQKAREGGPSRSETVGGRLTLQGWITDAPPISSAAAADEQRPIVLLAHCIMAQPSGGSAPNQHQRPTESSQLQGGACPSGKKTRGAVPKLPYGAPSVYAPVNDWVKFIHQYQNQSDNFDESSQLSRMFPGALGFSLCPDNDKVELIQLLAVKGWYRALLEWAEVAPAIGSPAPWEGGCSCVATMANVATYLAANGITYHNANDALKWAWRAGNEYIAQIISNGGDKDPNTKVIIDQMRATLNELLPMGKHHSLEWIDLQAHMLGVPPKSIAPYEVHPIEERVLYILREFTKSAALYDLPCCARGEGSNAGGVLPIPANTLEEERWRMTRD
ncbi:hypothetical protein EDC04DRAFT_2608677 [Pisolithus marmoratus]|nr:hypothetical protein EDC04DRAFT_2608677 [Pisolithus marmoratus]